MYMSSHIPRCVWCVDQQPQTPVGKARTCALCFNDHQTNYRDFLILKSPIILKILKITETTIFLKKIKIRQKHCGLE